MRRFFDWFLAFGKSAATLITLGIAGCALYVGIKQTEIANRQTEIAAQALKDARQHTEWELLDNEVVVSVRENGQTVKWHMTKDEFMKLNIPLSWDIRVPIKVNPDGSVRAP